jgi:flagella basal body P-ring formation protein FlgA
MAPRFPRWHLAAALLAASPLTPALAQGTAPDDGRESLERLVDVAREAVTANLPADGHEQRGSPRAPDPRLRLPRCAGRPEGFLAHPGQPLRTRQTVGVRCAIPAAWTVYLQVEVQTLGEVAVLRRAVARGERLMPGDVYLETRRIDQLPGGWFGGVDQLLSRRLLRHAGPGTVLTPAIVGHGRDIEKGQRVVLLAAGSGISVGMPGEALGDASRGDRIRVRNLRSDRIVEGIVRSEKVVEVLLK